MLVDNGIFLYMITEHNIMQHIASTLLRSSPELNIWGAGSCCNGDTYKYRKVEGDSQYNTEFTINDGIIQRGMFGKLPDGTPVLEVDYNVIVDNMPI